MACITERRGRLVIDFYDQHGKRRWKTLREGITKRDAQKELDQIKQRIERGSYHSPKEKRENLAFSKVAANWLKAKSRKVRHSTLRGWKGHIENHLTEYYGQTPVTGINLASVEAFLAHCEEKGVSIATTKKILDTLGAILTYACRKKYIDHNPVKYAEKPNKEIDMEEEETIEIYTPDQIPKLINGTGWVRKDIERDGEKYTMWVQMALVERLKYKTLIMMAVDTGMRQGELIGSKWDDLDWGMAQVQVKRTYNHGRFYPPKSKAARRKIDLSPQMLNQLAEWKKHCSESELNLIFPNGKGNPINSSNLYNRVYLPAIEKAGIPRLTFHALRHTFASILIDQGENIKYIQAQLGHSKASTTLDIYGHLMKTENPEAARKRGNLIFPDFGSKMVASRDVAENEKPKTLMISNIGPLAQLGRAADF